MNVRMRLRLSCGLSCALAIWSGTAAATPGIKIDPPFVDFGCIGPLQTKSATMILRSVGSTPLTISGFQLTGAAAADFTLQNPLKVPTTMAVGANYTFAVTFTPPGAGAFQAALDLLTDDPMAHHVMIPLDGCGASVGLTALPPQLTFPVVLVGNMAPYQLVTIQNAGNIDVTIKSVTLGGANPNSFQIVDPGTFVLPVGKSTAVPVTCQAVAAGPQSATFDVNPIGAAGLTVKLLCNAVAPLLQVAVGQGTNDFGDVPVGSRSDARTISVRNSGTLPLTIVSFVAGDAAFGINTAGTRLALDVGQIAEFDVVFQPSAIGKKQSTIGIFVQGTKEAAATITVIGNGVRGSGTGSPGDGGSGALGDQPPLASTGCSLRGTRPLGDGLLAVLALAPSLALMLRRRRR